MNGPVSTVVIIDRGTWNSDISLIGHESPVEVTAFNPRMFRAANSGPTNGEGGQQWITIIACAGQDRVLSIWNTLNPRPLVITQDIAEKSISDLCWSPEGMSLFISSYDGSITVCIFEEGDLGEPLPLEENSQFLTRYGLDRHGILLPESPAQLEMERISKEKEVEAPAKMMAAIMGTSQTPIQQTATPANLSNAPTTPKSAPPPAGTILICSKLTHQRQPRHRSYSKRSQSPRMGKSEWLRCSLVAAQMCRLQARCRNPNYSPPKTSPLKTPEPSIFQHLQLVSRVAECQPWSRGINGRLRTQQQMKTLILHKQMASLRKSRPFPRS
jgi:hypothetical protein